MFRAVPLLDALLIDEGKKAWVNGSTIRMNVARRRMVSSYFLSQNVVVYLSFVLIVVALYPGKLLKSVALLFYLVVE